MKYLNWVCFILICLDTVSYIIDQGNRIGHAKDASTKVAKFIGLCVGIAARVYVLYNTLNCWLLA